MPSSLTTPLEPASPAGHGNGSQAQHRAGLSRLVVAAHSARGLQHAVNEDAHSPPGRTGRLFVVADGVGGGAMASLASSELVARLHAALEPVPPDAEALRQAVLAADREIALRIAAHSPKQGAATLAMCARRGASAARWLIAWVGDCRIYRLGRGTDEPAQLLTQDDTYRQLGETPPPGGSADDPARMVGNGAVLRANTAQVRLRRGETLVLCSDGLHKHLGADDIARLLRSREPLAERCRRLVDEARAQGSGDDATVLAIERHGNWMPIVWALLIALVLAGAAVLVGTLA